MKRNTSTKFMKIYKNVNDNISIKCTNDKYMERDYSSYLYTILIIVYIIVPIINYSNNIKVILYCGILQSQPKPYNVVYNEFMMQMKEI